MKEIGDTRLNVLTQYISELLEKTFLGGDDFSETIAGEVEKHRKYLKYRLYQMEKA